MPTRCPPTFQPDSVRTYKIQLQQLKLFGVFKRALVRDSLSVLFRFNDNFDVDDARQIFNQVLKVRPSWALFR